MGCACTKYEWMPPEWRHAAGKCRQARSMGARHTAGSVGEPAKCVDIDWLAFVDRLERRRAEMLEAAAPRCPDAKGTPRALRREWAALTEARQRAFAHIFYTEHRSALHASLARAHRQLDELSRDAAWRLLRQSALDDADGDELLAVADALRQAKAALGGYLRRRAEPTAHFDEEPAGGEQMRYAEQHTSSSASTPEAELLRVDDDTITHGDGSPPAHDHADASTGTGGGELSADRRAAGQWHSFLFEDDNDSFATAPSIASSSALDFHNAQALSCAVVGGRYFPGAFSRRVLIARQMADGAQAQAHSPLAEGRTVGEEGTGGRADSGDGGAAAADNLD